MSEYRTGVVVDGRYRVISRIGTGGMADVYLAEDMQLGRNVALKLLHRRFAEDPGFVERFRREARAAAGLQHPNVVSVFDRGSFDDTYYIAMEYLDGRTLKELIKSEAPVDPKRAIEITIQILKAARFAHRHGVIHRDLKPHNVMIDSTDHVKVTDFGIARAGASDMTETGSIMGTAQYLSPEQAQGHPVSAPSDLYSIAVVLYEMLTGRLPFDGESAVTIALKHVSEPPVPPSRWNPGVPPALEAVVLWALNKNVADRPANADEFIEALQQAREVLNAPPTEQTAMMRAVGPAAAVAAGAGLAGLAGGAAAAQAAGGPPTQMMQTQPGTSVMRPTGTGFEPVPEQQPAGSGDDDEPEKKKGWAKWWPWLAALLALLLIGGLVAFLLTRPSDVKVPALTGQTLSSAESRLHSLGLKSGSVSQYSNTAPPNTVLAQSIDPGREVAPGTKVVLAISRGRAPVNVPGVAGKSLASAKTALEHAGLKVGKVFTQPSKSTSIGNVIKTSPQAGYGVQRGRAVNIYVSRGVLIPSVADESSTAAQATLGSDGFRPVVVKVLGSGIPVGQVISTSPRGGSYANFGTTVTLYVAKKPPSNTARVPDVLTYTKSDATNTLTSAGFKVIYKTTHVSVQNLQGTVINQSPTGGTRAKKGSTVTLWIGKYKGSTTTTTNTGTTTTGTGTTGTSTNPKKHK